MVHSASQKLEDVWGTYLDKQRVATWAKGLLMELANTAVDMVEAKRTAQVFSQMDTPMRDWCLGQDLPQQQGSKGTQVQVVQVEVHRGTRPITPTMRSPVAGEGWLPISNPDRPSIVGTPKSTPSRRPRVGGSLGVPQHSIPIDSGGLPMEHSGLLETYMRGVSPAYLPELQPEEGISQNEPEGAVISETLPDIQEVVDSEDEDTSTKESTGGSPRVPKSRKRKTSSERMIVTSETIESEGTPVFKACRKAIVKGKDIGNHAAKSWKKNKTSTIGSTEGLTETIGETLGEVFVTPALTHKTSLYKQYRKEQAALCHDAMNPNYGGKG